MSDGEEQLKPTYIMVPRKFVIAVVIAFICTFSVAGASIQWSNYINNKANERWCAFFKVLDSNPVPPRNEEEKRRRLAFDELTRGLGC